MNIISSPKKLDLSTLELIVYNNDDLIKDSKIHFGYKPSEVGRICGQLVSIDKGEAVVNNTELLILLVDDLRKRVKELEEKLKL